MKQTSIALLRLKARLTFCHHGFTSTTCLHKLAQGPSWLCCPLCHSWAGCTHIPQAQVEDRDVPVFTPVFLHAYMPSCCPHFGSCQGVGHTQQRVAINIDSDV